jgi:hypothetical protein
MADINLFFDTEFTRLDERYVDAKLISIGFIDETGEHAFYAELDHWHQDECSEFTRNIVLPLLEGGEYVMNMQDLGQKLKRWIDDFDTPVMLWSDAPDLDWRWLSWIFLSSGIGWPSNLSHQPKKFDFDASQAQRFNQAIESSYSHHGLRLHHALDDAKANCMGWIAVYRRI